MPSKDTVPMTIRIPEDLVAEIDAVADLAAVKRSAMAVRLIRKGLSRVPETRKSGKNDVFVDAMINEENDHE